MKVLVATNETQGQRLNDFCWTTMYEPVGFSSDCDREDVDGRCGCRRSMVGILTGKTTTTMTIIDDPTATAQTLKELLRQRMITGGWDKFLSTEELQALIDEEIDILIAVANAFTLGSIVERRGDQFQTRIPRT